MHTEPEFTHETYLSPFTWRYGSAEMRAIWSEAYKRRLWRRVWVALATAQHRAGLVTAEQVADLRAHQDAVNLARSAEIEREIHHDVMAEVRAFAEQCPLGRGIIHLGATSADVQDNADALRVRESLALVLEGLAILLDELADRIETYADHVCMGFTHLQPAEPTTIGYRLAVYAQDLWEDYLALSHLHCHLRGKGIKGAVGTAASYAHLLSETGVSPAELESMVMDELGLEAFPVTTQVYPRKQDYRVLTALAGLAASLYRMAFDVRILQSPPFGEWHEPFASHQVGSSAMPFKRNPIHAENVDSLARYVAALPRVAWDNAAHSLLERTLDDSANRRVVLAAAFLATDEILHRTRRILNGMRFNEAAIARNVRLYGGFAATEGLLMELVNGGADRQSMHERIRQHAMEAWQAVERGEPNPLVERLCQDPEVVRYLSSDRVREVLEKSALGQVGDAPQRACQIARRIRSPHQSADNLP